MPGHVVLCPNPFRDEGFEITQKSIALLSSAGFTALVSPMSVTGEIVPAPDGILFTDLETAIDGAALIVSLGGDGTMLHTARAVNSAAVPIIGINLGNKGFLAEIEPSELDLLVSCAQGNYTIERRMMADVCLVRNGQVIFSDCSLNDAAIVCVTNTLQVLAFGDGHKIMEFSGDGITLATPTGSTAYSMSAGGPLVEPTAENIIITPICAHDLSARSFVLHPDRKVMVRTIIRPGRNAVLSVDGGQPIALETGDEILFSKSTHCTLFAHTGRRSFYDMAFEKLGRVK